MKPDSPNAKRLFIALFYSCILLYTIIDNIRPMDWKHITCPIYFNGCRLSLSAFRAYKVQMYFGILRLSLHSICGTWSVLDIGFYNCSIPFASKATLLCKVY